MVKRLLFLAIALCMFVNTKTLMAQGSSGSVFLQGDHLEVGISDCGTYGTPIAPPAGGAAGTAYHPTETGLGFVADSDLDGWTVGSPQYCGDFFLPGSPVEGFGLSINGNVYLNSNGFGICAVMEVPGSNTTYIDGGDTVSSTWEGTHPDGFDLKIRTAIPKGRRYFTGTVTLTNTSSADLNEIYFVRQLDPDNDQPWGGGYTTTNKIVSQPSASTTDALVTATGSMGCFLGLGARHYASRVSKGGFFIIGPQDTYCGTGPFVLDGESTADEAIAVSFYFAKVAPGEKISFSYAYILAADELEAALQATAGPALVADGLPIPLVSDSIGQNHYILSTCPGDSISISLFDGDNYNWEWTAAAGLSDLSGSDATLVAVESTTYFLTAPLACGDHLEITLEVVLQTYDWMLDLTTAIALCPGNSVILGTYVPPDFTIHWTPEAGLNDPWIATPVFDADVPDSEWHYEFTASTADGCLIADSVHILVYPEPDVVACDDKYISSGSGTTLSVTGGTDYVWSPEVWLDGEFTGSPYAFPPTTTTFTVSGIDHNGCIGYDEMVVNVLGMSDLIIMPNAFSPNGDGLNDIYRVRLASGSELIDLQIFNRWGQQVFHSNSVDRGWDGSFKGIAQELGNYTVMARVKSATGDVENKTVSLTLVR